MDLEMTGLDIGRHVIVEVATLITDDDLAIVAEGPDLVVSATPEQLDGMDDFVRAMHTKSGLLAEIAASDHHSSRGRGRHPGLHPVPREEGPDRAAGR